MNNGKSQRIYRKISEGQSDGKIRRSERISQETLAAYKAGLTTKLQKYIEGDGMSRRIKITGSDIDQLNHQEKSQLLKMLDKTHVKDTSIRDRVIELLKSGAENSEVYEDPQLRNVNPNTLRAHIAHYNMGSYD